MFERPGVRRRGVPTREVAKSRKSDDARIARAEPLSPFRHFGNREFKSEGVVRQGVPTHGITNSEILKRRHGHG
jgi:hypothetical protein